MKLQNTIKELTELISTRKNDYDLHLANKLIDPATSSKTTSFFSVFNKVDLVYL